MRLQLRVRRAARKELPLKAGRAGLKEMLRDHSTCVFLTTRENRKIS